MTPTPLDITMPAWRPLRSVSSDHQPLASLIVRHELDRHGIDDLPTQGKLTAGCMASAERDAPLANLTVDSDGDVAMKSPTSAMLGSKASGSETARC